MFNILILLYCICVFSLFIHQLRNTIRDCFMTGDWKDDENAETLLKMDDDTEDIYGDFEDLETGKKFEAAPKEEVKDEVKEGKPKVLFSLYG